MLHKKSTIIYQNFEKLVDKLERRIKATIGEKKNKINYMKKEEIFDKIYETQRKGSDHSKKEFDEVLKEYPNKLYRYQKYNRKNVITFQDDCAFFSSPNTWPDKTDTTILFDVEEDKNLLEKERDTYIIEYSKNLFSAFLRMTNRQLINYDNFEEIYDDCVKDGEFDWKLAYQLLKEKIGIGKAESTLAKFKKELEKTEKEIDKALKSLITINSLRDKMAVLCLSENYFNENQWDKFSDGGNGYCIEYTINFMKLEEPFKYACFPILYGTKERLVIPDYINDRINSLFDKKKEEEIINKMAKSALISFFTKNPSFSGEEEWRFALEEKYKNTNVPFPFATSIYLGNNMRPHNQKVLINIAKKKGMKIYKRSLDATKSKWIYYEL